MGQQNRDKPVEIQAAEWLESLNTLSAPPCIILSWTETSVELWNCWIQANPLWIRYADEGAAAAVLTVETAPDATWDGIYLPSTWPVKPAILKLPSNCSGVVLILTSCLCTIGRICSQTTTTPTLLYTRPRREASLISARGWWPKELK